MCYVCVSCGTFVIGEDCSEHARSACQEWHCGSEVHLSDESVHFRGGLPRPQIASRLGKSVAQVCALWQGARG